MCLPTARKRTWRRAVKGGFETCGFGEKRTFCTTTSYSTLSQIVRLELTEDQQNRLVDIFFSGQRRALLGRDAPSPWETAEEFFRQFSEPSRFFDHVEQLVGRTAEVEALHELLEGGKERLILLQGPGGIGKTRILKDAIERYTNSHLTVEVRFLSPTGKPERANIETMGPGPKLLVIDDAHDRDDLASLFAYAAVKRNRTTLLLGSRPYAVDRIRKEAASLGLAAAEPVTVDRLTKEEAIELAVQVLQRLRPDLDTGAAESIALFAGGSPLVLVMAAKAVAESERPTPRRQAQTRIPPTS